MVHLFFISHNMHSEEDGIIKKENLWVLQEKHVHGAHQEF